jgi:hypothetical protein
MFSKPYIDLVKRKQKIEKMNIKARNKNKNG